MSTQVYLSTCPRKNWLRLVPFSRSTSARGHELWIVDEQRTALAAYQVLGFMEGERSQVANGPQRPALVRRHDPLRRVLDHEKTAGAGNFHDRVHIAAHPGIVDRDDRLGSGRDGGFDPLLIDVQRVRSNVHEHRHRAAKHERVGSRDERVRRQDDFVAGLDVSEIAAISSAAVQECVSNAFLVPVRCSSQALQRFVKPPSPARCPAVCACATFHSSFPVMKGLLKGIRALLPMESGAIGTDSSRTCWMRPIASPGG